MGFEAGKPTNARPKAVKVKAHTRAAPAPKPTETQVAQARAQERAYGSQAHAVRVTANRQKRVMGSSPSGDRPQNRAAEMRAAPVVKAKKKGGGGGLLMGTIAAPIAASEAVGKLAAKGASAYARPIIAAVKNDDMGGMSVIPSAVKTVGHAATDAAELAVTTPSSVAHLASTAVHHPEKVPGLLAAPYKELVKDPGDFIGKHPVSTALMLAPGVRMPGRIAGKAARIAGKQTLERPAATLPGTALKEARVGSRDAFMRAHQTRVDRANPNPVMTVKDVQTRVDEHFDAAKQHTQRVVAAAARQAKAKAKSDGLNKAETRAAIQAKVEGATAGARTQAAVRFAHEFGATHQVTPEGNVVAPKGAAVGTLHPTRAAAEAVVARLNHKPKEMPTGVNPRTHPVKLTVHEPGTAGKPVTASLRRRTDTQPLVFTVRKVGDQYAALPKVAANRMYKSGGPSAPLSHESVGASKSTGAKIMRRSRGAFTQAVLPFSTKWLAGQGVEAGIRSAVAGAGPMDWLRMHQVVKRLNAETPGTGDALMERVSGGQFGLTGAARDFAQGHKTLAHEFAGTPLRGSAAAATAVAHTLPLRTARAGFGHYSRFVMNRVNGIFENTSRKAMAGQAIKNSPLMEHHLLGLTDKALKDAADGLRATENQVQLARAVDRMYGKYQKFSPEMRTTLMHWTPFLPWYLNVASFLTKVLPHDHPLQAALLADAGAATEEWRKSHRLSLLSSDHLPNFLLGSAPVGKGNSYQRIAHYTPFGVGSDVAGATSDLALPQIVGPLKNLGGVDWKWQRLTHGGTHGKEFNQRENIIRALVTAAEEQIPGVTQAGKISGVTPRYVDKDKFVPGPGAALKKLLPTTATANNQPPPRGRVVGRPRLNGTGGAGGGKLTGTSGAGGKLN